MAIHEVELQITHAIPVGNKDIEIPVKVDEKPLGRLKISRGGIDWMPSPNKKKSYTLRWKQLAELMEDQGTEKPR